VVFRLKFHLISEKQIQNYNRINKMTKLQI